MAHISGIADRRTLARLLTEGDVSGRLRLNSAEADAIEALEHVLFYLGLGDELDWARLGADGHYEAHTQAAVSAFASREGLSGDGAETTLEQLARILERYDEAMRRDLTALTAIHAGGQLAAILRRSSPDIQSIRVLQRLLYVAGYGDEMKWDKFGDDGDYGNNTVRSVAAFANDVKAPSDGTAVSDALAAKLIEAVAQKHERPEPLVQDALSVTDTSIFIVTNGERRKIASKVKFGNRQGWRAMGDMAFATFLETRPDVFADQPPSILHVLHAVVQNEGSLDAVNAYDNAFISFGILQWTAGVGSDKGELAAFLNHLKGKRPAVFQKYFGIFGLDVVGITGGSNSPAGGHLALHGQGLDSSNKKEVLRQGDWIYRFWKAGQDPMVEQAEVEYALTRLNIFYRNPEKKIMGRFVGDYVSSEVGVALLLDQHINRPGHVPGTLTVAVKDSADELGDPSGWGDDAERQLLDRYLDLRHRTTMTDSKKRAKRIQGLAGTVVSARRGSFQI
ncbi:MAG: hypothetical protein ACREQP_16890 [Candidatus Binatia bacterium]